MGKINDQKRSGNRGKKKFENSASGRRRVKKRVTTPPPPTQNAHIRTLARVYATGEGTNTLLHVRKSSSGGGAWKQVLYYTYARLYIIV